MAAGSLELIVGRLSSILENEASLPGIAKDMVREIISKLQNIQDLVTDLDRQKRTNESWRSLLRKITDVVHEVDDIMDVYLYHMMKHQKAGLKGLLMKYRKDEKNQFLTRLQMVRNDLDSIIAETNDIRSDLRVQGRLSSNDAAAQSSNFASNDDVVGIEESGELLFRWLVDPESRSTLNWVVGMGGTGKTTLVREIYNKLDHHDFDLRVWFKASQSHPIPNLLKTIAETSRLDLKLYPEAAEEDDDDDDDDLEAAEEERYRRERHTIQIIHNLLEDKRYLIVLDDLWGMDVWYDLKNAFPDNGLRSRIVITTTEKYVAHSPFSAFASHILILRPLKHNDAWNLFCRRAFLSDSSKDCPPDLEKSGRAIVAICEGLPLAVVAFGDLMSQKPKTKNEWEKVEKSLSDQVTKFLGY